MTRRRVRVAIYLINMRRSAYARTYTHIPCHRRPSCRLLRAAHATQKRRRSVVQSIKWQAERMCMQADGYVALYRPVWRRAPEILAGRFRGLATTRPLAPARLHSQKVEAITEALRPRQPGTGLCAGGTPGSEGSVRFELYNVSAMGTIRV